MLIVRLQFVISSKTSSVRLVYLSYDATFIGKCETKIANPGSFALKVAPGSKRKES